MKIKAYGIFIRFEPRTPWDLAYVDNFAGPGLVGQYWIFKTREAAERHKTKGEKVKEVYLNVRGGK